MDWKQIPCAYYFLYKRKFCFSSARQVIKHWLVVLRSNEQVQVLLDVPMDVLWIIWQGIYHIFIVNLWRAIFVTTWPAKPSFEL